MKEIYEIMLSEFYSSSIGLKKIDDFYIYKHEKCYGVGVINTNNILIDEMFANVQLRSISIPQIENNSSFNLIILTSSLNSHKKEFASFCLQFLEEKIRSEIQVEPLKWWKKWRELIGNKFSEISVYDVIAELLTIEKLSFIEENVNWRGPSGSTIDIETLKNYYEVKSSILRYENDITISSHLQLDVYDKPTFLIFYKMEQMSNGQSINKIVDRINKSGIMNTEEIELKLDRLGFRKNSSARNKSYVIHEIRKYDTGENFPRININSFNGKKIPDNIKKITYNISLDGIKYENWEW